MDTLRFFSESLRRHDESTKNLKTEPLFKLHSFRLKLASRLWTNPELLATLEPTTAEALRSLLEKAQVEVSASSFRKKLHHTKVGAVQHAGELLNGFSGAVAEKLAAEPAYADLRRSLAQYVLPSALKGLVLCTAEFASHGKGIFQLANFFSNGPTTFRDNEKTLAYLSEVFAFTGNAKFMTVWLEDLDSIKELPRPGKSKAQKIKFVSLLFAHLERSGQLDLLGAAIFKVVGLVEAKLPATPEPFDYLVRWFLDAALLQIKSRYSDLKVSSRTDTENLFKVLFRVRKAAHAAVKIAGEGPFKQLDDLFYEVFKLMVPEKARGQAANGTAVSTWALARWDDLASLPSIKPTAGPRPKRPAKASAPTVPVAPPADQTAALASQGAAPVPAAPDVAEPTSQSAPPASPKKMRPKRGAAQRKLQSPEEPEAAHVPQISEKPDALEEIPASLEAGTVKDAEASAVGLPDPTTPAKKPRKKREPKKYEKTRSSARKRGQPPPGEGEAEPEAADDAEEAEEDASRS